jgi:hypothetical protein
MAISHRCLETEEQQSVGGNPQMIPTKSAEKISSSFRGFTVPALVQDPVEKDGYLEDFPGTGRFDIPDTP